MERGFSFFDEAKKNILRHIFLLHAIFFDGCETMPQRRAADDDARWVDYVIVETSRYSDKRWAVIYRSRESVYRKWWLFARQKCSHQVGVVLMGLRSAKKKRSKTRVKLFKEPKIYFMKNVRSPKKKTPQDEEKKRPYGNSWSTSSIKTRQTHIYIHTACRVLNLNAFSNFSPQNHPFKSKIGMCGKKWTHCAVLHKPRYGYTTLVRSLDEKRFRLREAFRNFGFFFHPRLKLTHRHQLSVENDILIWYIRRGESQAAAYISYVQSMWPGCVCYEVQIEMSSAVIFSAIRSIWQHQQPPKRHVKSNQNRSRPLIIIWFALACVNNKSKLRAADELVFAPPQRTLIAKSISENVRKSNA